MISGDPVGWDIMIFEPYNNANIVYCNYLDTLNSYKLSDKSFRKNIANLVKIFTAIHSDGAPKIEPEFYENYSKSSYGSDKIIEYDVKISLPTCG